MDATREIMERWLQRAPLDVLDSDEQNEEDEQQRKDAREQLAQNAMLLLRPKTTRRGCVVARAFVGLGKWLLRPLSSRAGAWRLPDSWAHPTVLQAWGFLGAWHGEARPGIIVANACASRHWRRVLRHVVTRRVCDSFAMLHTSKPLHIRRNPHALCWSLLQDCCDSHSADRTTAMRVVLRHFLACSSIALPVEATVDGLAERGHVDIVAALSSHAPRSQHLSWLRSAAENNQGHVVRFLSEVIQERGGQPHMFVNDPLQVAAENGHINVVRYLCGLLPERICYPRIKFNRALLAAAARGHVDVVRYLCELPPERGVDPGAYNNSALFEAVSSGRLSVMQCLCTLPLARGVNPGADDNKALRWSARYGYMEIVQYLCELPLERGVDPGANNNAALQQAAQHGHVDVVKYLCELPLERGVEPGANDNMALQQAAECGHMNMVRYLCMLPPERGVDPRANDNQALRAAKAKGHVDVMFFLCTLLLSRVGLDNFT